VHKRSFLICGLGPSGGILAAHLAHAGAEVAGIDVWPEHLKEINSAGIRVEGFTSLKARLSECRPAVNELERRDFDYCVIATKTPQLPSVVSALESLNGEFKVVSLQNGLDNEDFLASHFGRDRVLRVAINYAGIVKQPGVIEMVFFQKPNYIGCICDDRDCPVASDLAAMFTDAGLQTQAAENIKYHTWRKTILNAALSPVSAVLGMTMADVMACGEGYALVELLLKECIEVARHAGFDYGEGFYDYCLDYLQRGGHHKPSMLVDLENGNQTEIDYINGKIDSYGYTYNVAVPVNKVMTALVKAKQRRMGSA